MRCDQFAGLPAAGKAFLDKNAVEADICCECNRPLPREHEKVGTYLGMFCQEFPLFRFKLKDGGYADEFHQCSPWSSGPVHFLGLKLSDGTVFEWDDAAMEEWL